MLALFLTCLSSLPLTQTPAFCFVHLSIYSTLPSFPSLLQKHNFIVGIISKNSLACAVPDHFNFSYSKLSTVVLFEHCESSVIFSFRFGCVDLLDTWSFCWENCQTSHPCFLLFFPVVSSLLSFSILMHFPTCVSFLYPLAVVQMEKYLRISAWCA